MSHPAIPLMQWSQEQSASVPRKTLLWVIGIAGCCLLALAVGAHMRQDALDQQLAELKYRLEAMERRPSRLSASDRAFIEDSTDERVQKAIQSAER